MKSTFICNFAIRRSFAALQYRFLARRAGGVLVEDDFPAGCRTAQDKSRSTSLTTLFALCLAIISPKSCLNKTREKGHGMMRSKQEEQEEKDEHQKLEQS